QEVNPGFRGDNLLLVRLSLPSNNYSSREAVAVFFDKILPRIQELPGVRSVGAANVLPLSAMNVRSDFTIAGRPPVSASDKPAAQNRWVSSEYFQTLGIPLLLGRAFTARDSAHAPGVAIIDEELARRYWPNDNPVGTHLIIEDSPNPREVEIIGVAGSVMHVSLDEPSSPTFYGPIDQMPKETVPFLAANCSLAIRTDPDPLTLETAVRREVQSVDSNVPVSNIKTMAQVLSSSTAGRRFNLLLLTIFAGTAVLLAVTGVYAVMSYSVTRRNQEIGIRIALGAQPGDVVKLVLGKGVRLVVIGVSVGIVGAVFSTRLLSSLLYGVRPLDPLTFALT
ncbi:MAG: ABC transporter permease, partial [Verrucomicrobiota bacterium]